MKLSTLREAESSIHFNGGILLSLLLAFLLVFYVQYPALRDLYKIDDDLRQYYWMARFADPSLFPNDNLLINVKKVDQLNILGFNFNVQYYSLGFSLLYQVASLVIYPILFNKVLPFLLMLFSVFFLYRLGIVLKGRTMALLLSILFVTFNLSASPNISVLPGLERSFSFPLLIVFLYFYIRNAPIGTIFTLAFQSIFYFPIFVVSSMSYGLSLIRFKARPLPIDWSPQRLLPLIFGVILGLIFFLPALLKVDNLNPGPPANIPIWENPRFSETGRIPIFADDPPLGIPTYLIMGYGGLATYLDIINMVPLLFVLMLMIVTMGVKEVQFPRKVNLLLLGSLIAWGCSWGIALVFQDFLLRYPFKYTSAVLPLFLLVIIAYNAETFAEAAARFWNLTKGRSGLVLAGLSIILIMIAVSPFLFVYIQQPVIYQFVRTAGVGLGGILFIFGTNQLARLRLRSTIDTLSTESVSSQARWTALTVVLFILVLSFGPRMRSLPSVAAQVERDLHQFIRTLPKNALIAGDPFTMSNIPLFAQRSVLFSDEIVAVSEDKIFDFFNAYYAESSPESILAFCQKYGVNYLVVNQNQFTPTYLAQGDFFYAPYNETIAQTVAARSDFVLPQIPDSQKVYQNESFFLVPCTAEALSE